MKAPKLMTTLLLVLTFSMPVMASAGEEIVLPAVAKAQQKALAEGTERTLSLEQIQELLPWAKNSKLALEDMLSSLDGQSTEDKIERLISGMQNLVVESAPKHSELFMRYTLNRAVEVDKIFTTEMDKDAVGTNDVRLRFLVASARMALKYYQTDVNIIEKRALPEAAVFGREYFNFIAEINKSVFDASAQYKMGRLALQWYHVDLNRDLNNTAYAPKIYDIYTQLSRTLPETAANDARYIRLIRDMKKLTRKMLM